MRLKGLDLEENSSLHLLILIPNALHQLPSSLLQELIRVVFDDLKSIRRHLHLAWPQLLR